MIPRKQNGKQKCQTITSSFNPWGVPKTKSEVLNANERLQIINDMFCIHSLTKDNEKKKITKKLDF